MSTETPLLSRPATLAELRARLDALETGMRRAGPAALPFGLAAIDEALPWGGLPRGALHEIMGADSDGAAAGFCVALLARLAALGPVIWIAPAGELYAPGLAALGLDPARLVLVEATRRTDKLWALEEALRTPVLSAAVAEIDALDLTASRRLQLAAEAHGVTALLLGRRGAASATTRTTAARTRWHIAAKPGASRAGDIGPPRWRLTLEHCRGGTPAAWNVEWHTGEWREVAPAVDRPARAKASGAR